MVTDKILFELIRDFLKIYLPKLKKRSAHTIRSYKTAIDSLLEFVKNERGVELSQITFDMLTQKTIEKYLISLDEQGNSVATRNLRLRSLKAFFAYAADMNSEVTAVAAPIAKMPVASEPKFQKIDYLSETALRALLAQPDLTTAKGLRDRFFMLLMYDTGARLQEIRELKLSDISWGKTVQATLHGKGDKYRDVPITANVTEHLKFYLKNFHSDSAKSEYLFYVVQRGQRHQLSDSAARKVVREYGVAAKKVCPELPEIVHPHMLRHSRAMHLYQAGNELPLIQQWLGHANLETTYAYAFADTEMKRKALEATADPDSPLAPYQNPKRFTLTDEELIRQLYGLL